MSRFTIREHTPIGSSRWPHNIWQVMDEENRRFRKHLPGTSPTWVASFAEESHARSFVSEQNNTEPEVYRELMIEARADAEEARADAEKIREALRQTEIQLYKADEMLAIKDAELDRVSRFKEKLHREVKDAEHERDQHTTVAEARLVELKRMSEKFQRVLREREELTTEVERLRFDTENPDRLRNKYQNAYESANNEVNRLKTQLNEASALRQNLSLTTKDRDWLLSDRNQYRNLWQTAMDEIKRHQEMGANPQKTQNHMGSPGTVAYVIEHIKHALYHSCPTGVKSDVFNSSAGHVDTIVITLQS